MSGPSTTTVVGEVANGATSSSPETHCERVPAMCTSPPRGRAARTSMGGQSSEDETSSPIWRSAASRGPIGRRWKYFCPVTVTSRSPSAARPTMKYSVVPELPAVMTRRVGW